MYLCVVGYEQYLNMNYKYHYIQLGVPANIYKNERTSRQDPNVSTGVGLVAVIFALLTLFWAFGLCGGTAPC